MNVRVGRSLGLNIHHSVTTFEAMTGCCTSQIMPTLRHPKAVISQLEEMHYNENPDMNENKRTGPSF